MANLALRSERFRAAAVLVKGVNSGACRAARQSPKVRLQRNGTSSFSLRKVSPMKRCLTLAVVFALLSGAVFGAADEPKPIKILFLGDKGHHQPEMRFRQLQPVLAKRGIDL